MTKSLRRIVLSYVQADTIWEHQGVLNHHVDISPDLGLTTIKVEIGSQGVIFPNQVFLSWETVEEIRASKNNCFILEDGEVHKIMGYSELTNRSCSLMPTQGAPTLLLSGIPMHRIKGIDPYRDTLEKIKAIKPVVGFVLDTATGLGYTAIEAARSAQHVTTIELDPVVLEIARQNPWSAPLFEDAKITQIVGDSYEVIRDLEDEKFSRIIHDPPAFSLAGDLYGKIFYAELYRVLRRGGRVFHYIGDPQSKSGRGVRRGVVGRLKEVGFSRVINRPRAFGVVAFKV